jgi:hypothetical protein
VAVVINPSALRARRAEGALTSAEHVHELLASAKAAPMPESAGLTTARAEELISEIRAGREAR